MNLDGKLSKDSLNLAEFPISFLGVVPPSVRTIRREDEVPGPDGGTIRRSLVITGSDAWGLPNSFDDDVLLACIELSRRQDNFAERTVFFTFADIIGVLGTGAGGKAISRIEESLRRWCGVTLAYDGCWGEAPGSRWVSKTLHLIDEVEINRKRGKRKADDIRSFFRFGGTFLASLQSGYLKELNLAFYYSLSTPLSQRVYRYVSKYLARRSVFRRNLETLAYEKIGMARTGDCGQLKRSLDRSFRELADRGILAYPPEYQKRWQGGWTIIIRSALASTNESGGELTPVETSVVRRLVEVGVNAKVADRLVGECGAEVAARQLDWLPHRKAVTNVAPFLVEAIRGDYAAPTPPPAPRSALPTPTTQSSRSIAARELRLKTIRASLTAAAMKEVEGAAIAASGKTLEQWKEEAGHHFSRSVVLKGVVDSYLCQLHGIE